MKEFIKNNYNIEISKIFNNYFYYQNEKIKIITYNKKENIYNYINIIKDKRISEFVINKNNEIITKYKDKNIILLKINDLNNKIDLNYLNIFNVENNLKEKNIIKDWEKQIDEEEQKLKDKYKDYYIGLSEIAISMLRNSNDTLIKSVGHDIKFDNYSKEELNNPINFIKVEKLFNITNYLKYKFFNEKLCNYELENILNDIKKENSNQRFLAYMLYTNYYFETKNKEIIIKKHKEYEKMILFIKEKLKN